MGDATWRYRAGDQEVGPLSTAELCALFAGGKLPIETPVWCAAVGKWVAASSIPGFRQAGGITRTAVVQTLGGDIEPDAPGESNFFKTAARFSCIVALIFILCSYGITYLLKSNDVPIPAKMTVSLVCGLLMISAFVAGIVGLFGIGRRGVLAPALTGVLLNGFFVCAMVVGAINGAGYSQARIDHDGKVSLTEYPGWNGAARVGGRSMLTALSFDDASPTARRILGDLNAPCSLMDVVVDNLGGDQTIDVYPSSLQLRFTGRPPIDALDADVMWSTIKRNPDLAVWRNGGVRHVPAGGKPVEVLCFIPGGLDLRSLRAVTIRTSAGVVSIPGRFFSASERRDLIERAKAMATARAD